jgi:hypothetical protein
VSSVDQSGFDPLERAILDSVYEAAWVALAEVDPPNNREKEAERKANLRQRVVSVARPGAVEFDALYQRVLSGYDASIITPLVVRKTRSISLTSI